MEIVLAVIGVILIGYLFWQSYLLSQYKKIVDNQKDVITKLSRTIDTLKPFQVWIATLRGGNSPHAQKPNVSGRVYNSIIKKEGKLMTELETEIYELMAECEAEGINGNSTDENADPRLERIGNILTLLQVLDWEAYKRVAIAKFNVTADYFED